MKLLGNDMADLDLTCDFPARKSFCEALLERLLSVNEQEAQKAMPADSAEVEDGLYARELSDDEVELLAAAQGQPIIPAGWLGNRPVS